MVRQREESFVVNEEQPYSEVIVTISIRILRDAITRSRVAVNVYPDAMFHRTAKKLLTSEQYGRNPDGQFVVSFAEHWLDLNHEYPRFDTRVGNPAFVESIEEMNRHVERSVGSARVHIKICRFK